MINTKEEMDLRSGITIRSVERALKLRLIEGMPWIPSTKLVNSKKLGIINKYLSDEIISGSFALSLFFNLQRSVEDIDVISSKPHSYGDLHMENYPEDGWMHEGYVGSRVFSNISFLGVKFEHKVDFFKYDTQFINWRGLKIQDPLEIIKKKSKIILESYSDDSKEKHSLDLEIIGMKIIHGIDVTRRSSGGHPSFCLNY